MEDRREAKRPRDGTPASQVTAGARGGRRTLPGTIRGPDCAREGWVPPPGVPPCGCHRGDATSGGAIVWVPPRGCHHRRDATAKVVPLKVTAVAAAKPVPCPRVLRRSLGKALPGATPPPRGPLPCPRGVAPRGASRSRGCFLPAAAFSPLHSASVPGWLLAFGQR